MNLNRQPTSVVPTGPCLWGMLLGGLLACGCSSFHRDWKAAAAQPTPANSLEGRWRGVWRSEVNGHHGPLRCVVTKDSDQQYQARFRAGYLKILSFGYTLPLQVTSTNGQFQFRGAVDVGWYAGGVYHYEGRVKQTNFLSIYQCQRDHGTFEMGRPPAHE